MRITTSRAFDKQFRKQPVKIKREFRKRIAIFLADINDPTLKTHKLSGKLKNLWSFNVTGDMRVVFEKISSDTVLLIAIGSHSELYS